MTLSHANVDAPLAEHFGKAKWLLVYEGPDRFELISNTGLNGRHVAEVFAAHGCSDVIAMHMGAGAHAHVAEAGMKAWQGEPDASARSLAERLAKRTLRKLEGAAAHDGSHGCAHDSAHEGHQHQHEHGVGHGRGHGGWRN